MHFTIRFTHKHFIPMKNLTRQQFEEFTKHGSVRKPTGLASPGEDLCESFFEAGVVNGYSLADICHFYAHVQRTITTVHDDECHEKQVLDAAYDKFVRDAAAFAGTLIDAAEGLKRRAVSSAVGSMLGKFLRIILGLRRLFL